MTTLTRPSFVSTDIDAITKEMVAQYEAMSGKTLYPAQIERLLLDFVAYREMLLRIQIQKTGEQNLLSYAEADQLDLLGELLGVTRLGLTPAEAMFRFELVETLPFSVIVPAGTRVCTEDGLVVFATTLSVLIPAGASYGDTTGQCTVGGTTGNGILGGWINVLVDPVSRVAKAYNTSLSGGGVDFESDEALRTRIREAPYRFAAAGPSGSYKWHAKTADPTICDVGVTSPEPGVVNVYPLTTSGPASEGVRQRVDLALNEETVRPLTDHVQVIAPTEVPFAIDLRLVLFNGSDTETVRGGVQTALQTWVDALELTLGRDLVPHQLVGIAQRIDGVYQAEVITPTQRVLEPGEWPHCTSLSVTVTGVVDG